MEDTLIDEAVDTLAGLAAERSDSFEVFCSSSNGITIEAKDGTVDAMKVRSVLGIGVRTIKEGRLGFGYSTVLDREALTAMVDRAIAGSTEVVSDKYLAFPEASPVPAGSTPAEMGLVDPGYGALTEDEKIAVALEIEKTAFATDPRVKRVRKASFGETVSSTRVLNSSGVDNSFSATYYSASVSAVAEQDGESQMGWEMGLSHMHGDINAEEIGRGAAERATSMLGARKIKTTRCPAVIENMVVCELLETLAPSFLADNVAKGKSMLGGKAGKTVASTALTVYDDGHLKGGWSSSPFDAEGVPRQRTTLLDRGVLREFLYDTYWARREGTDSTGSAARGSFKGLPSIGISNLFIEPGTQTRAEIFREMGKGLFITEVMGIHMINMVSGDFSVGASGFFVESGEVSYPVRSLAISGNLLELFSKVTSCASDMRFIGSIGAPSLLVSDVEASGS